MNRTDLIKALVEILEWTEDDRDLPLATKARQEDFAAVLTARERMLRILIEKVRKEEPSPWLTESIAAVSVVVVLFLLLFVLPVVVL